MIPVGGEQVPGVSHFGGFLDTCGGGCEGNAYCVSTSRSRDRANAQTANWKIHSGSPLVRERGTIKLQNGYLGFQGGYLDTRNPGCEGNILCVSTSSGPVRDGQSTEWAAVR
jgi:hypothetical protein